MAATCGAGRKTWMDGCSTDFWGSENALHDIIVMDICHYTFVQTHRMHDIMDEPEGKLWALKD